MRGAKPQKPYAIASPRRPDNGGRLGIVELFAGVGCVARGFERTEAFETILLTDNDADAYETYVHNYPAGARYLKRNVQYLRPGEILDVSAGRPIVGLLGCPPCQGFSSAGRRDPNDRRNILLRHYFRLVKSLEPKFLVMENVPRVFEYDLFKELLREVGKKYQLWKGVLNSALFGVPQTRQRAIVIGYHRDLGVKPTSPVPTHLGRRRVFEYATQQFLLPTTAQGVRLLGLYPEVGKAEVFWTSTLRGLAEAHGERLENLIVVQDAIGDLPEAGDEDAPVRYCSGPAPYAAALRDSEVHNHRRWRHRADMLQRLLAVPEGGGLLDKYRRTRSRPYFSQAYTRLHRRGLARTITTNFHNPGSGRFLHYEALRTLTVREAARLQGIEDGFVFIKFRSVQERLVGNAFPVPLAEALARHIASQLAEVL